MAKKRTLMKWNIIRCLCLLCTIVSGLIAIVGFGSPPKTDRPEWTTPKESPFEQSSHNIGNGYTIIPKKSRPTSIQYEDYETIKRKEKDKLDLLMVRPEEYEKAYNKIPQGGWIVISITGFDIESVNPENFTYIVKKGDKEILRVNGNYGGDAVPDGCRAPVSWTNFDMINLNEPITDSLDFYIIDNISSIRNDFKIIKNN